MTTKTVAALLALMLAFTAPALAQKAQAQKPIVPQPLAPAAPYKAVAVVPPGEMTDAALIELRGQIGEAAKRRDASALARLVVGTGFFWQREQRDAANKRKSGFDNLSAALGLANKDSAGWDILTGYAEDPTASPSLARKSAVCAPADPGYDRAAFDNLLKATQTDVAEWGYTVSSGIEVHATAAANAPVVEKLGLHVIRVMPETKPGSAAYQRIATPAGKIGYVSIDAIAPFGNDQICYVKDAGAWKIGGYIGGGEPQ
jgi:hypothetical protein